MEVKGYVERIIFTSQDSGHTILEISLSSEELKRIIADNPEYESELSEELVCTGILYLIHPGEYVVFKGDNGSIIPANRKVFYGYVAKSLCYVDENGVVFCPVWAKP